MSFHLDLNRAWRRLKAAPAFTAFSIVTLALGIGATTAAFSVIRVVVGPPPGVADPGRLVEVYHYPFGSAPMMNLAWDDYQDLRARQSGFEGLTGWTWFRPAVAADGRSESGIGEIVDGDYFRTLGVIAQAGRLLGPDDDRPNAPPVAVISAAARRRLFEGDRPVVGQTIKISGTIFEIVGVTGPDFAGLFNGGLIATEVWVPMTTARLVFPELREQFVNRDRRWVFVRGRLKEHTTIASANAQVAAIASQLDAESPIGSGLADRFRMPFNIRRPWGVRALSGRVMGVPDQIMRLILGALVSSVTLVGLVAFSNLANLMLARDGRRRGQMAVSRALGASRLRLVYEAMLEPLILAAAGGAAGLGVASLLTRLLSVQLPVGNGILLQAFPRVDVAVFWLAMGTTILALAVVGAVPAIQSTRLDVRSALAFQSAVAVPRWRGRSSLIAAQVSVSVVLVAMAGLYAGEVRRQAGLETGVNLRHLALAQVDFGTQRYEPDRARQVVLAAAARLAGRPGVVTVATVSGVPAGLNSVAGASVRSIDELRGTPVSFIAGTPEMFDALGVAITRGRRFDSRDGSLASRVLVLSEKAAGQLFGGSDPVGHEVIFERRRAVGEPTQPATSMTVVGVAADTGSPAVGRGDWSVVYLPLDQHYEPTLVLAVRTTGDPTAFVPQLRAAILSVDASLAITQAGTGLALAGPNTSFFRVVAGVAALLGTMALILALAGLYGILSHVVADRTREIGIRLALGAGRTRICRMVLKEGLSPVLLGLGGGLVLGVLTRAALQPLFVRIIPRADWTLMILVPVLFIASGAVACYMPAVRAAGVDPNVALRDL